jgi:hypothetical protein
MTELADIFNQYGDVYREQYGERLLPSHRAALKAVVDCRTPQMGGRVYRCLPCDEVHYSYHSCQNRHCPKCQTQNGQAWLEKQTAFLLPTPYFLLTFTVPQELRALIRAHQKQLYNLLFRTSAQATQQLARDPRLIGAKIGMVGVLHTWGRNLVYHPHVHYLVPAGGLTEQGVWRATSHNFFLPVKALSRIFRAKFRDALRHTDWFDDIPTHVWQSEWVVHCKPVGDGAGALKYLAPYIFRVAISNRRILKVVNDKVSFRFRLSDTGKWRTCTLEVLEFIRRFLQHALPKGFVKVRYYGLFSPGNRHLLAAAQQDLTPPETAATTVGNHTDSGTSEAQNKSTNKSQASLPLCPVCGREMILTLRLKRPWTRRPP